MELAEQDVNGGKKAKVALAPKEANSMMEKLNNNLTPYSMSNDKATTRETVVIAKCVGCENKREIRAGEVPSGDVPMCDKCFMPMVAEKAIKKSN